MGTFWCAASSITTDDTIFWKSSTRKNRMPLFIRLLSRYDFYKWLTKISIDEEVAHSFSPKLLLIWGVTAIPPAQDLDTGN